MIKWAGRIIVLLGVGHMLSSLALTAPPHAGAWFSGEVWGENLAEMSAANGGYWVSLGSFGIPLILIGLLVLWLDRRGIAPPSFVGWTLGAWSLLGAVIFEPAPWPVGVLMSAMLIVGSHRAARDAALSAP